MSCLTKIMMQWHFWIFSLSVLLILWSIFIVFNIFFKSWVCTTIRILFFLLIITSPITSNSSARFFVVHLASLINFLPLRSVKLSQLLIFSVFFSYFFYMLLVSNCHFHFHLERPQNQTPCLNNYSGNRTFGPGCEPLAGTLCTHLLTCWFFFPVSSTHLFIQLNRSREKHQVYVLLVGAVFYYPIINVIRSWSPVSRQPPISSSVINSSLSIITRSKIALPRVRCHPFCVRKWSSIIFRDATNVLLLPAGGLWCSPPAVTSCSSL